MPWALPLTKIGVYGEITFAEYRLDLIPFDDDLLSLELETSYRDCFLVTLRLCYY
jgi:hypothetical protein